MKLALDSRPRTRIRAQARPARARRRLAAMRSLLREYGGGLRADTPHALYSGTKSFWGRCALRARATACSTSTSRSRETIASWRDDPWKRRVTMRMLLSLTAGFGFRRVGQRAYRPTIARSRYRCATSPARVRLRRHPIAGFRCRPRAQTRRPERDAARVPARAHPRSRRRATSRTGAASATGRILCRRARRLHPATGSHTAASFLRIARA